MPDAENNIKAMVKMRIEQKMEEEYEGVNESVEFEEKDITDAIDECFDNNFSFLLNFDITYKLENTKYKTLENIISSYSLLCEYLNEYILNNDENKKKLNY